MVGTDGLTPYERDEAKYEADIAAAHLREFAESARPRLDDADKENLAQVLALLDSVGGW